LPSDAAWKPLQSVGKVALDPSDVVGAYDPSRPFSPAKGSTEPKVKVASAQLDDMVDDLVSNECVMRVSDDVPVTMTAKVVPKPGSDKLMMISDCRELINKESVPPKKFKLPSLNCVLERFPAPDLFEAFHLRKARPPPGSVSWT